MKIKKYVLLGWILFLGYVLLAAPPVEAGKSIFMTRCAACHNVNKQLIGPALANIDKKQSVDWIISFVRSSQTMVKAGDKDAVALFEQFNKIPMPDHPDLTEENIKTIIEYIKSESKDITTSTPYIPGKLKTAYTPLKFENYYFFGGFIFLVVMLVVILYFAVQSKTYEQEIRKNSVPS